ncbi:hypothetical protein MUK42_21517 [Musa troglodytarum]|uniref:DUF569 domain-containing protein n=1 Tax=Musa troglodytarum TaxID=320322 RepID=A0A9E7JZW1_9LILI|nr:hypothetical protein MUK42_21517 [Musa troglodytarum]
MEFFEGVATIRLQSCHGTYLVADEHSHGVTLRSYCFCDVARWIVEITDVGGQWKVFLDNLGLGVNWEPLREGVNVQLKCHFG